MTALSYVVKRVTAETVLPHRQRLLRPTLAMRPATELGDRLDRAEDSFHVLAIAAAGAVLGCCSIVRDACPELPSARAPWRVRGVGVAEAAQGLGVGRAMMAALTDHAATLGGDWAWASARTAALPFYAKLHFETRGSEYEVPVSGPHYVIVRRLTPA